MRDETTYRLFVEEMGDLIEEHGLPHMAGRILSALLVCVPPHMTMEELAVDLRTSKGAIFLTHDAVGEEDARLWLYLPLLGIPKEFVSDEERGGSFAGSSLSYEDLSESDRRKDYDARLVGEETLVVGGRSRSTYVIESKAKPGADVSTLRTVVWIDQEFFTMLKMEGYNDLGGLESTMEVRSLKEFEGRLTADIMLATSPSEGSSTTITFVDRHRPEGEIADSVFAPETLAAFDPAVWGF